MLLNCRNKKIFNNFNSFMFIIFESTTHNNLMAISQRILTCFRSLMLFKKIQNFINLSRFFSVNIPVKKLQVTTSRSSGPGGQSVNKSETKVQIRFNVQSADWLTEDLKEKFLIVNKAKITQKGDFIVECDDFSNQHDNKKACIRLIREAVKLAEEYTPVRHLTFLEQIEETKTPEQILKYKMARRESRRKTKQLGHKKLEDF